jgi:hypothetical protein
VQLLRRYGYPYAGEEVTSVISGVTFAELDQNHIVPNAGTIVVKGVWYPRHNM